MKKIFILFVFLLGNIINVHARPETLSVFDSESGISTQLQTNPNLTFLEGRGPEEENNRKSLNNATIANEQEEEENWVQVDGTQYPYSSVVYISYRGMGCSGALIGPYTVLTAAHCFSLFGSNTDPSQISVYPGGTETKQKAKGVRLFLSVQYGIHSMDLYDTDSASYDWAIIVLNKPLGKKNGYLGVRAAHLQDGDPIHIFGFPGIKSNNLPWHSWGNITEISYHTNTFDHSAKMSSGNSGGPILHDEDSSSLIGLANFHRQNLPGGGGTRISESVLSFVEAHRDKTPNSK